MAEQQAEQRGTKYADLFADLAAPFAPEQVKERSQGGRTFTYITCRTAANRLDDVLGPENWWDRYKTSDKSVECELTIRLPDGTTLTKVDAGAYATMQDEGDNEKAGYSDAFKRAAAKFLVGRYLYRDGLPTFVYDALGIPGQRELNDSIQATPSNGGYQSNGGSYPPRSSSPPPSRSNGSAPQGNGNYGDPRTGGQLFAWAKKKTDEEPALDLVKRIDAWAKQKGFPYKWKEWADQQVADAYAAARKVVEAGGEAVAPAQPPLSRSNDDESDIPF